MKNRNRSFRLGLFAVLGIVLLLSGNQLVAQSATTSAVRVGQSNQATAVKAYYFHATRRCATCEAVEAVTRQALADYYSSQVSFESINREKDKKNPLIQKYKVSGQTLLIVDGEKVVNLTNDAFLNARTNPDKFKAKLKSTIDPML